MTITYPNRISETLNRAVSLSLDEGAVIDLQPPTGGVTIEVECGSLWITQAGDPSDHMIGPSRCFSANGNGLIVVQALSCSKFKVPTS